MFPPYTQQDSQEFLMMLLDHLDTELKQIGVPTISDTFRGSLRNKLKCVVCNRENFTTEPFNQLMLPIPDSESNHDLNIKMSQTEREMIAYYEMSFLNSINIFSKDRANLNIYYCLNFFLGEQNTDYFCSHCNTVNDHTIQFSIVEAPKYLIISLKRFSNARWKRKISDQVFLPSRLDLYEYCGVKDQYELIVVIQQISYFFKGHYKAYVKKQNQWYLLDDKNVSKVDWAEVFNSQAYIFMYRRLENQTEEQHENKESDPKNTEEKKHEDNEFDDLSTEKTKNESKESEEQKYSRD